MASHHNPWAPIADLMSGFVVVVLVLFAAAASLPRFTPPPTVDPLRERQLRRERFLDTVAQELSAYERKGLVIFRRKQRMIEFSDISFKSGSACLTEEAASAADAVALPLAKQLEADPDLTIQVEGHTDPRRVPRLTKSCGYFADNTQLSTLRAANVRNRIGAQSSQATLARLPVTGWGPDRLRNQADPTAPENRRVELQLLWSDGDLPRTASAPPNR